MKAQICQNCGASEFTIDKNGEKVCVYCHTHYVEENSSQFGTEVSKISRKNVIIWTSVGFFAVFLVLIISSNFPVNGSSKPSQAVLVANEQKNSSVSTSSSSSSTENSSAGTTTASTFKDTRENVLKTTTWDFYKFLDLQVGEETTGVGGATYNAIIKAFGQPSTLENTINVTSTRQIVYNNPDNTIVTLTFIKQKNGDFLLSEANETGVGNCGVFSGWTLSGYNALQEGAIVSGAGGTSFSEVRKSYYDPYMMDLSVTNGRVAVLAEYNESEGLHRAAVGTPYVSFIFVKQSNGDWLMEQKDETELK